MTHEPASISASLLLAASARSPNTKRPLSVIPRRPSTSSRKPAATSDCTSSSTGPSKCLEKSPPCRQSPVDTVYKRNIVSLSCIASAASQSICSLPGIRSSSLIGDDEPRSSLPAHAHRLLSERRRIQHLLAGTNERCRSLRPILLRRPGLHSRLCMIPAP